MNLVRCWTRFAEMNGSRHFFRIAGKGFDFNGLGLWVVGGGGVFRERGQAQLYRLHCPI